MKNKSKKLFNLGHFIDSHNVWAKKSPININNLTGENAKTLFGNLDNELSPENLHCDGEISNAQAQAKYKYFKAVEKELLSLGFHQT